MSFDRQLALRAVGKTLPQASILHFPSWTNVRMPLYARRGELSRSLRLAAADTTDGLQTSRETSRPQTKRSSDRGRKRLESTAIDKSLLSHPEPRRIHDREHVRYVTRQSCLICGRRPSDAHHLRCAQNSALSCKVSDEFTVPLCRGHHREVHRSGDEAMWWEKAGIDPTLTARALWLETHPLPAGSDKMPIAEVIARKGELKPRDGRQPRKDRSNAETKPIEKAAIPQ